MSEYGLDVEQVRDFVVRPALNKIGYWTGSAENLVLGTALYESRLKAIRQYGGGPALGLFQMERITHDSLWKNYINRKTTVMQALHELRAGREFTVPDATEMVTNMLYAAAMCRVQYLQYSEKLPLENDPRGLAHYYKTYYNSVLGKATVTEALPHFNRACKLR